MGDLLLPDVLKKHLESVMEWKNLYIRTYIKRKHIR
jgi:hypothetical protein